MGLGQPALWEKASIRGQKQRRVLHVNHAITLVRNAGRRFLRLFLLISITNLILQHKGNNAILQEECLSR